MHIGLKLKEGKCNKYNVARDDFLSKINNENFSKLSDSNKFMWLMSNEDKEICKNLANYLATCMSVFSSLHHV